MKAAGTLRGWGGGRGGQRRITEQAAAGSKDIDPRRHHIPAVSQQRNTIQSSRASSLIHSFVHSSNHSSSPDSALSDFGALQIICLLTYFSRHLRLEQMADSAERGLMTVANVSQ